MQKTEREEEDYFVSVDLMEEIPIEVRASESVPPDQNLPSDSVESYATTVGKNGPSDEIEPANQGSAENDESEQSEGEVSSSEFILIDI